MTGKIPEFYRFALLLTGDEEAASQVLVQTLADAGAHLAQFRNDRSRNAWIVSRLRERSLKRHGGEQAPAPERLPSGTGDASRLVDQFRAIPEPGRSALAVFYLDLFPAHEIAALLNLTLEELASALAAARAQLQPAPATADAGGKS